jgi:hypothetical protein
LSDVSASLIHHRLIDSCSEGCNDCEAKTQQQQQQQQQQQASRL